MADSQTAIAEARRVSGWAVVALGTSVAIFCPVLTLVGSLLAIRALVQIRAQPERTGRGMALAALWIGAVATLAWIVLMFWWNGHVREVMLHGPQDALREGLGGNVVAFKHAFVDDAATVSDEQARDFLDALRSRYGGFVSAEQDRTMPPPAQDTGRSVLIRYVLTFERDTVKSDVRLLLFASGLAPRLQSIHVTDAARGDMEFPPAAGTGP